MFIARRRVVASLVLCPLLACGRPEATLDREAALARVVDELVDGEHPTAVVITDAPLPAGARVSTYPAPASPPPESVTLSRPAWLVWIDDAPLADFGHRSRVALVDASSGELTLLDTQSWPTVDGQPVFDDADREPAGWDHATGLPAPPARALDGSPRMSVGCVPANPGRALVINAWRPDEPGEGTMAAGALNMKDAFTGIGLDTTYLGPQGASEADGVASPEAIDMYFETAGQELQPGDDFVLMITGHGWVSDIEYKQGQTQIGGYWETDVASWLSRLPPGVNIIVFVNGCHSGGMLDALACTADLSLSATSEELASYGDLDPEHFDDLNPGDQGSEWVSSLTAAWWDALTDPEAVAEVAKTAESTGGSFLRVLAARAFERARPYDAAERRGLTTPMIRGGDPKTSPPDVPQDPTPPTCTPPMCDLPPDFYDDLNSILDDLLGQEPGDPITAEDICTHTLGLEAGNQVLHSDGEKTAVAAGPVDLLAMGGAPSLALPGLADKVCGDNGDSYVVCAGAGPESSYMVLWAALATDLPIVPEVHYQYGFVLDLDGDAANNYEAPPAYPADFFDGTDRWYQATATPGGAWSLTATDVIDSAPMSRASGAHLIVRGSAMALLVPVSELGPDPAPGIRFTAFEHAGDWGATGPWSGDLAPMVGAPLWRMSP